ncbi:hypothetical protein [Rhodococcus tibetensis]|uniref:Uncharacterized protein n=1 Tax=Rhodococcus tibetensis TaxID=2965064 RepID=A0ABT1QEF4_9NOCA|nr:hypothetical protein [Rhodococcus sp. FXJ9.536]MCQ4120572.1 hypothetical protein [Rhodococcus sp. FXJ9.536]
MNSSRPKLLTTLTKAICADVGFLRLYVEDADAVLKQACCRRDRGRRGDAPQRPDLHCRVDYVQSADFFPRR